jgi:murein L,D-transpeptidase YafK
MRKSILKQFTSVFILIFSLSVQADTKEFLPSALLKLDQTFSHHVLLVEKSSHQLHLYENSDSYPKLLASFPIASGKVPGDKIKDGDKKTPEGIYRFKKFYNSTDLINKYGDYGKIYGIGAFTSNYPNFIDRMNQKTGGGIWLHATDDETRIAKGLDSRGCVVLKNSNLRKISEFIDLNFQTPIIIQENIEYWDKQTWKTQRKKLLSFVNSWKQSWQNLNLNQYMSHYSSKLFKDRRGRGYHSWKDHKKSVFARTRNARVQLNNITILFHKDYAEVRMVQRFQSNLMDDSGKKTLILKQDPTYQWKIVHEYFGRMQNQPREFAFTPSPRYFNE